MFYLNVQTSVVTLKPNWSIGLKSVINGYP